MSTINDWPELTPKPLPYRAICIATEVDEEIQVILEEISWRSK